MMLFKAIVGENFKLYGTLIFKKMGMKKTDAILNQVCIYVNFILLPFTLNLDPEKHRFNK